MVFLKIYVLLIGVTVMMHKYTELYGAMRGLLTGINFPN
jgi:hypothetical protein